MVNNAVHGCLMQRPASHLEGEEDLGVWVVQVAARGNGPVDGHDDRERAVPAKERRGQGRNINNHKSDESVP